MIVAKSRKRPARVTIKHVAEAAGVAVATVSAALNGTGRVSHEQSERLKQIAKDLDYRPKLAAQLMRAHSTGHIGLLMVTELPDDWEKVLKSGHAGPIIARFIRTCEERSIDYHLGFWHTGQDPKNFKPPRLISNGLVDGLLIEGGMPDEMRDWLDTQCIPYVRLDEPSDYCVLSATDVGTAQAVERLAALGHRRIGFTGGPQVYETHRLAALGFERAASAFGIDTGNGRFCKDCFPTETTVEDSAAWVETLLSKKDRPSAFVCSGMMAAKGILSKAKALGLRLPEDLSVIGLGASADSWEAVPVIGGIEINYADMVKQGLYMLRGLLDGSLSQPAREYVSPRLIMRGTSFINNPN